MRYRVRAENGDVTIAGARFAEPDDAADLIVEAGGSILLPGLVNAHDHLHRNHYPRLGTPPYADVYAWGEDLHGRYAAEVERLRAFPRRDALLFGALKNLLGAATTVAHHDAWEPAFDEGFPVRVPRVRHLHTLGLESEARIAGAVGAPGPLLLHLAEGGGPAAAAEVGRAASLGLLGPDLVAVHCVGVDAADVELLRRSGAAVVWCPTSNHFLYGRGPDPALLLSGVDVLLGTDALLTGDGTLLDELRAAAACGTLGAADLLQAVGGRAARRLGLAEPSLEPGADADFVLLGRPLFEARAIDVRLAVVGGRPRLGDEAFLPLFHAHGEEVETLEVGGQVRWVEAPMGDVARRAVSLCPEAGRVLFR